MTRTQESAAVSKPRYECKNCQTPLQKRWNVCPSCGALDPTAALQDQIEEDEE